MTSKWWIQDCNVSLFDSKTSYFSHIFPHGKTGIKMLLGQSHKDAVRIRISLNERSLSHSSPYWHLFSSPWLRNLRKLWEMLFNLFGEFLAPWPRICLQMAGPSAGFRWQARLNWACRVRQHSVFSLTSYSWSRQVRRQEKTEGLQVGSAPGFADIIAFFQKEFPHPLSPLVPWV